MLKKFIHLAGTHYTGLAQAFIVIYLLCSFFTVTVLSFHPAASAGARLVRYGLYALIPLLCSARYLDRHKALSLKEAVLCLAGFFREHLLFAFVLVLAVLNYVCSGSLIPFALVLLLAAARPLDLRKLLQLIFATQLAGCLVTVALAFAGLIPDLAYSSSLGVYRHSLGYIYPLEMHSHVFFLFLLGVWLYRKKYGWLAFGALTALNFGVFCLTVARTSFLMTEAAALLMLAAVKMPAGFRQKLFGWKHFKTLLVCFAVCMFVLPIAACLLYTDSSAFWVRMNTLMTSRLSLCREALETYPVTLFGQKIAWLGSGGISPVYVWEDSYNFADISYVKDLLDYGILLYVLLMGGYCWMMQHFALKKDLCGLVCCVCVLGSCVMEPRLLSVSLNTFLLFLSIPLLYSNRQLAGWMNTMDPFWKAWKTIPPVSRTAAAVLAFVLAGAVGWHLFTLNQYGARRQAVRQMSEERKAWQARIMNYEKPEDEDPFQFASQMARALKETGGAYDQMAQIVPLGRLRSCYIEEQDFERLPGRDVQEDVWVQEFESRSRGLLPVQ